MTFLESLLGTYKYNYLTSREKKAIEELIEANPVFIHLVAGIIGTKNWRRFLGEAYFKYVKRLNAEDIELLNRKPSSRSSPGEEKTKNQFII
jgi:hypothetical protein